MMNAVADLDRALLGLPTMLNHDLLTRFTIRAFHGPGKTHYIGKEMHWWNFTRRGRIAVTAPKEKQLTTRVWPEFRKILGGAVSDYKQVIKTEGTKITWLHDVDWCALAESAASPENLQGLHDDWLLYLVEEASGVPQAMFPAIEGTLSTPGAVLIMIGNPTQTQGEFYDSHNKRGTMELYYKKAIRHDETPRISQKWVQSMIAKYGIDSPVVQVRVFGNFVDAAENQLITLQWINNAFLAEFETDGSLPTFRLSVDVADGGMDSSVVSVAYHYDSFKYFKKQYLFNYEASVSPIKLAKSVSQIYDSIKKQNPNMDGDIVVDAIGVGAGTAGFLIEDGYPVVAYKGGSASDNSTEWRNRRTQSYMCYRDDLRDSKVVFADDYYDEADQDDFEAQHTSIKTKPGTERIEELETKESMKARGIKSPDMADACAMQYATQSPSLKGSMEVLTTIHSEAAQSDW